MNNLSNSLLKNIISYYEKNVNTNRNIITVSDKERYIFLNAGFDLDTIR